MILWGTKKLAMIIAIKKAVITFSPVSRWILKKFMFDVLVCCAESNRIG